MRFRDEYLNGRQDFESEMLSEVAEAVYAEDLDRARRALDDLHRAGSDATAELLRRAKASACGRPQGAPDLAEPFVLPVPGHEPGDALGGRGVLPRYRVSA